MKRPLLSALLYASLALAANPALADLASDLSQLREGDMRKLVISDAPQPVDGAFQTLEGEAQNLAARNGKVRIVNFWATWCDPCRDEKPALDALNKSLSGEDFEVIAIATGRNSESSIKQFNSEVGIESLTSYVDPRGAMARQLGVLGLPVSIILDRDGREIARMTGGADWNSASARAIVERIIGDTGS